jgi:hypothetical protein
VTYRGVVRGKTIELEEPLPFPEGQPVAVSVEPLTVPLLPGSPAAILQALREAPPVSWEAVDELERAIEESQLPVVEEGLFDDDCRRESIRAVSASRRGCIGH